MEDLQKATHYLDKLMETADYDLLVRCQNIKEEVDKFTEANYLTAAERDFVYILCSYRSRFDLGKARYILQQIMETGVLEILKREELMRPGTPDDGGHHASQK